MSPVVGNATLLGLPGAQPPPCHSGPHPGPGERDSRERLPEASPSSYACCPSCLGGHSVPTSPLLPSAEGTQHQTSLLESGSEGLHEPSFGPRPASVVLHGITRTPPTGSAPTPDPHLGTSQPCSLHRAGPHSQPHPQFWSSQIWQGPRMFVQGISGFRGL